MPGWRSAYPIADARGSRRVAAAELTPPATVGAGRPRRSGGADRPGIVNPWLRPGTPLVIAHRGHSLRLPEQTMAAFRAAIELGAEMIEADVRATRDGRMVMLHDATLDRTTTGSGPSTS